MFAVVESEEELAPVRTQTLQGVGESDREVPEVALLHVRDEGAAFWVEHGDAAIAVAHEAPLGGLMPVQFPDPARIETHVHAGDGGGNLEVGLGDLSGPAAVLDAARRIVERGPELRKVSDISRGRGERPRELPGQRRVPRSRIDGTARVALRVYDALGRLVRVAEARGACTRCESTQAGSRA